MKPPKSHSLRAACSKVRPAWSGELRSRLFACARREAAAARQNFLAGRQWLARFDRNGRSTDRYTALSRGPRLKHRRFGLPTIGPIRRGPIRITSVTISLPKIGPIRRGGTRVTSVTITRHAEGSWWAACTVERQLRPPRRPNERASDGMAGRGWGGKTAAAAGQPATQSQGGRHEPTWARQFDRAQPPHVKHFSLPAAPYGQLTIDALTAPVDAPMIADSASADGMAKLRRTIGRLQRYLNLGHS